MEMLISPILSSNLLMLTSDWTEQQIMLWVIETLIAAGWMKACL